MKIYDYLPNYITTMKLYDYLPNYITTMKLYDYLPNYKLAKSTAKNFSTSRTIGKWVFWNPCFKIDCCDIILYYYNDSVIRLLAVKYITTMKLYDHLRTILLQWSYTTTWWRHENKLFLYTTFDYNFLSGFYAIKERKSKFETIMAKDNCLRIPKIYQTLFSTYSFIKIFAIEVSAFLKK